MSSALKDARATKRPVVLALVLLAMALAFAATRAAQWREWWLRRQSIDQLRAAADHDRQDALIQYLYAARLVAAGATADAITPAGHAVGDLTSDSPPDLIGHVFALTGYVTAETGARAVAAENLKRAATLNPNDPFVLAGRGVLAAHADHACEAVDLLEKAAHAVPAYAAIWDALGNAYLLGAAPDAAIDPLRRAVALAPGKPEYHADLAAALGNSRRYVEAEAENRRAASLMPVNSRFACLPALGAAAAARTEADFQKAVAMFQRVLDTRPGDPALLAALAGLDIRFARYRAARTALEACVASADGNSTAWYNLSIVCDRLGDHAASARALHRAQQINEILRADAAAKQSAAIAAESGASTNPVEFGDRNASAINPATRVDHP